MAEVGPRVGCLAQDQNSYATRSASAPKAIEESGRFCLHKSSGGEPFIPDVRQVLPKGTRQTMPDSRQLRN